MVKSSSPPPRLRRPPPLLPTSGERFKGVRQRSWGRWVSEIRIPHCRDKIWLGSYSSAERAARAYDFASLLLRGPSYASQLNFADSTILMSTDDALAALVAGGTASPRTIQATAYAAANSVSAAAVNNSTVVQEGVAPCSNGDGSFQEMDDNAYPQSSETCKKDCSAEFYTAIHQCTVESNQSAHAGACGAMSGSCWIHDVLNLIISPKDKNNPHSFSRSLQLSPTIARCAVSPPAYGLQSSTKATISPDNFLQMLFDDYQYPLDDLLRDGFTAVAPAVTTRKRIDTELVGASCEVQDSTQLWSYVW